VHDAQAGLYHAWVETVCREFTWMHIAGSVVSHLTAPALSGPFTFSDVALPQQAMTPHAVRDVDGAWLIAYERNISIAPTPQCTGAPGGSAAHWPPGVTPGGPGPASNGPASIARAESPFGPWVSTDLTISGLDAGRMIDNPNPSVLPLADGSGYLMAFTSRPRPPAPYSESVGIAFARDWRSGVFAVVDAGAPPETLDCEDPFMYQSDRGVHVVCHRRASAPAVNPWNFSDCGGFGVSPNGRDNWTWSATPIYTTTTNWVDGGAGG
jgi:hypothetical protein